LTAALVSRILEPSGAERIRLAVGQRFYFNEQRVVLDSTVAPGTGSRSDFLLSASGRFTSALSAEANVDYSESARSMNRANYLLRWQPAPKKVLNLEYRRDKVNLLEQVDVSGQWPLANRWYGVGRVNYSLPDQKIAEGLVGLEYKADCWIFSVLAQRIPTATGVSTSAISFQLELSGLSHFGMGNTRDALRTIPGYQQLDTKHPNSNQ
jgi:LPS-assembly protein